MLNEEYEKKFGFRFVVFVAGRPRDAIIPIIKDRMNNSREQELATGLRYFLLCNAICMHRADMIMHHFFKCLTFAIDAVT